jgi:hypothetical protein
MSFPLLLLLLAAGPAAVVDAFLKAAPAPAEAGAAVARLFEEALPEKAERRWEDEGAEIWRRPLRGGGWAFVLRNQGKRPVSIDVIWKEHGLRGSPRVYDLFREDDRGRVHAGFAERVDPGRVSLLKVTP